MRAVLAALQTLQQHLYLQSVLNAKLVDQRNALLGLTTHYSQALPQQAVLHNLPMPQARPGNGQGTVRRAGGDQQRGWQPAPGSRPATRHVARPMASMLEGSMSTRPQLLRGIAAAAGALPQLRLLRPLCWQGKKLRMTRRRRALLLQGLFR